MSMKAFVYLTKQQLKSETGIDFNRTHLYEILAAAFNFRSYSALCTEGVFSKIPDMQAARSADSRQMFNRGIALGYPGGGMDTAANVLQSLVTDHGIEFVRFEELIDAFSYGWMYSDEEVSAFLLDSLTIAASSNKAPAHYVLALLNVPNEQEESDANPGYWYRESQKGYALTSAQQQFSDQYLTLLEREAAFKHHLEAATRLGYALASLELAEHYGDTSCFDNGIELPESDALRIADIAEQLRRPTEARRWLGLAAESGNTDAMLRLIDSYDHDDLVKCWTWVYLSQLLGDDPTRDRHYAINEDGSEYDDDIGGPMYVGGEDGLELPDLGGEQDAVARRRATDLHQQILGREALNL